MCADWIIMTAGDDPIVVGEIKVPWVADHQIYRTDAFWSDAEKNIWL
jgi:hypothetical protein